MGLPKQPSRRILAIILLLSSSPCATLVFAVLAPILPTLAEEFGKGEFGSFVAQMIMAMPGLGTIFGGILSGIILKYMGLRRMMIAGLVTYVLAGSAGLYVSDPVSLLASRFLLGFVIATHSTCVMVLLSEWTEGTLRAKILGFTGTLSGIVSVSAINFSGFLAHLGSWRTPFAIYLLALLFLVCALVLLRKEQSYVPANDSGNKGSLVPLIPSYVLILFLYLAVMMSAIQVPFLLAENGVSDTTLRSFMISLGSIGSMTSGALFGWIFARLGGKWTMVLFTAIMGGGFVLAASVGNLHIVGAACLIFGFGCGMTTPYVGNMILEKATPDVRGRAVGLIFVIVSAAEFLNPMVIAPIQTHLGIHGAFALVGSLVLLGSLATALSGVRKRRA